MTSVEELANKILEYKQERDNSAINVQEIESLLKTFSSKNITIQEWNALIAKLEAVLHIASLDDSELLTKIKDILIEMQKTVPITVDFNRFVKDVVPNGPLVQKDYIYAEWLIIDDLNREVATFGLDLYPATKREAGLMSASDKEYLDSIPSIISTLKKNAFQEVDSLPLTGEEGIIYLILKDATRNVYSQYIWETDKYIPLGDTAIDFSGVSKATNFENDTETGSLKQIVEPGKEHAAAPNKNETYGAKGKYSTVLGATSVAEGKRSFAHGTQNASRGGSSHAEGDSTETGIDAYGAHSEGYKTKTDAPYSHVEGWGNKIVKEIVSQKEDMKISGTWTLKTNLPALSSIKIINNLRYFYTRLTATEEVQRVSTSLKFETSKTIRDNDLTTGNALVYQGTSQIKNNTIVFTETYISQEDLDVIKMFFTKEQPEVKRYINAGTYRIKDTIYQLIFNQSIMFYSNNMPFTSFSSRNIYGDTTFSFDNQDVGIITAHGDIQWLDEYKEIKVNTRQEVSDNFYLWFNVCTELVTPTPPVLNDSNGDNSHTEGIGNITLGWASHTEGQGNRNYAHYSSVKGTNNTAGKLKEKSTTHEGHITTTTYMASGNSIDVGGSGNKAEYSNQTVRGQFNANKESTLLEIGNGENDSTRSNAFEVHKDGHAEVKAMGTTNNSVATKEYVDNHETAFATDEEVQAIFR